MSTVLYKNVIKQEMLFIANSFGFENARDFFASAFRYNDLGSVIPVMLFVGALEGIIYGLFGLQFMELIALMILFVFEILSGIWSSKVQYLQCVKLLKEKREELSSLEICEIKEKIEKYRFSSGKLKRAGAVMGFWLIILFVIWQFSMHEGMTSSVFNIAHFVFLSYVVSIYIVSVIENGIIISGNKDKFLPLSKAMKGMFKNIQK